MTKVLYITSYYEPFLRRMQAELVGLTYAQSMERLHRRYFAWSDSYREPLAKRGFDVEIVVWNFELLRRKFAIEAGVPLGSLETVLAEQVRQSRPDIVWYDAYEERLFQAVRAAAPRAKLVGWVGSAVANSNVWAQLDLILSCAQESVDRMRAQGLRSEQLHHAFDPRIADLVQSSPSPREDVLFIGQIARGGEFHGIRERLLEYIQGQANLKICSPSWGYGLKDELLQVLRCLKHRRPYQPLVSSRLRRSLAPPVFGLEMYRAIAEAKLTLNVHADSSPVCASNMRLFETTGVGGVLLTDRKSNLAELFDAENEIVVYEGAEDCLRQIRRILADPDRARAIATAGQRRTLKDHTFEVRADRLVAFLRAL